METAFRGDSSGRDNPDLMEHVLVFYKIYLITFIVPKHGSLQILGKNTEKQNSEKNICWTSNLLSLYIFATTIKSLILRLLIFSSNKSDLC